MKTYIQNYLDQYGYCQDEIVISEISGLPSADFHHIQYRSHSGSDDAENIIALTREEHMKAHSGEYTKEYLQEIHNNFSRPLW